MARRSISSSDGSTLRGAAITDAGSTSNVTLQGGSLWTMTGNSNVTNLTNASSVIQFTPPTADPTQLSSYKTLTAVNYVGQGGTIGLNTFLGADDSPSDRLVINGGTASGNSSLRITNTTGAGELTTGNGILVVDAVDGATTAAGAFSLARPALAGPTRYTCSARASMPAAPRPGTCDRTLTACATRSCPAVAVAVAAAAEVAASAPIILTCRSAEVVAAVEGGEEGGGGGGGGGGDDTPTSGRRRRSMRPSPR